MPQRLLLLVLTLLVASVDLRAEECGTRDSAFIYFGNGIQNDLSEAISSTERLLNKSWERLPRERDYRFFTSYNQTDGFIADVMQVLKQKKTDPGVLVDWLSSPANAPDWFQNAYRDLAVKYLDSATYLNDADASRQVSTYREALAQKHKVLVVAHSQGNFYANYAHRQLRSESMGIVAVATPASIVEGGGPWTTLRFDVVINLLRSLVTNTLGHTTENDSLSWDPLQHSFVGTYLQGDKSGNRILNDVVNQLQTLASPDCLNEPPPLPPCDDVACYDMYGNPKTKASSIGDPHNRTFDGLAYDFQGAGEYVLARSKTDDLEIQARMVPIDSVVSINSAIAARVNQTRVGFYQSQDGLTALVDGKVPAFIKGEALLDNGGALYRTQARPYIYTLVWPDHSRLRVTSRFIYTEAEISLAPGRKSKVMGLLGNFDDEPSNDVITQDGRPFDPSTITFRALYREFGDSWRVTRASTLFDYFGTETPEGFVDANYPSYPFDIRTAAKDRGPVAITEAESACRPLQGRDSLNDCILDSVIAGKAENLSGYFDVAPATNRIVLQLPPRVRIISPEQGTMVKGNVLVRGAIDGAERVKRLLLRVNGGAELDVTTSRFESGFALTLPNERLREGGNVADVVAEDDAGNLTYDRIQFTINPNAAPEAGSDLIVVNDINLFDNDHIGAESNVVFAKNLVNFQATSGSKTQARSVLFSFGHASKCSASCRANLTTLKQTLATEGFSVVESEAGAMTSIATPIKVVFLWLPTQGFDAEEIKALKTFAADGGRIVFIGENEAYYGPGIAIENTFLKAMGARMENKGGTVLSGRTLFKATVGSGHQLLQRAPTILANLVSSIELGPQDYPLYVDASGKHIVAAVAQINVNILERIESKPFRYTRSAPFERAPAAWPRSSKP